MYPKYSTKPYMPCNVKISFNFKKYLITDILYSLLYSLKLIFAHCPGMTKLLNVERLTSVTVYWVLSLVFSNKTSSVVKIIIGAIVKLMINNITDDELGQSKCNTYMSLEDQKMCAIFFVLPGHHSLPSHQNKKVFKMCHNMSAGLNFLPFHSDQSHNMKWGTTNNQIFHKTTKWPNTLATFGTCDQSYIKGSPQIESLEKFCLLSQPGRPPPPSP